MLATLRGISSGELLPLAALALAIGFFEALFWRGWMLQALERAFGLIPAVVLSSALYALYHVGYGMGWDEIGFLFFIGLMFACAFLLTRSVLVLWPVFQPSGQLITIAGDGLRLPPIASVGFLETLVLMAAIVFFAEKVRRRAAARVAELTASAP